MLAFAAGFVVDGAVGLASILKVPKIIIGIVLVGFATTTPEFAVSLLAALRGSPEIALGNAVGSVIVDDAGALALGILFATTVITIDRKVLRTTGVFLAVIAVAAFVLSLNGVVGRLEGALMVVTYLVYVTLVVRGHRKQVKAGGGISDEEAGSLAEHTKPGPLPAQIVRLVGGIAGTILASEFLVDSAQYVARYLGAPEVIIGLTIIAIGTSLPEIATCITAARRGHGDLAFGDILGADILNILWIVGASALANPIRVDRSFILFSFPWMLLIVGTMLLFAAHKLRLTRWKAVVLLSLYAIYLSFTIVIFYVQQART